VIFLPIIIKAQGSDSTNDVIKKFKKVMIATDIVQRVKDRRYYIKPAKLKAQKTIEHARLQKRARSLKKMKNVAPQVLVRMKERLGST
jgi:ribosomal protein S21